LSNGEQAADASEKYDTQIFQWANYFNDLETLLQAGIKRS